MFASRDTTAFQNFWLVPLLVTVNGTKKRSWNLCLVPVSAGVVPAIGRPVEVPLIPNAKPDLCSSRCQRPASSGNSFEDSMCDRLDIGSPAESSQPILLLYPRQRHAKLRISEPDLSCGHLYCEFHSLCWFVQIISPELIKSFSFVYTFPEPIIIRILAEVKGDVSFVSFHVFASG